MTRLPAIDLRSDASTLPTREMRQAMTTCPVGNHDFGEDPSILSLEARVADLLEKEAALFVHSGTMANLIAVMCQVEPGQSVLVSRHFHIFDHEGPALLRVAGCRFCPAEDETTDGMTRIQVRGVFEKCPAADRPRLLSLENTVNRLGGTLLALEHMRELCYWAHDQGLAVHLDGARLFNAALALGCSPARLAEAMDTVMVVFTKALAAPAGAALAGSAEVIERARRARWMLGGAWKQGGVLAAACQVGLKSLLGRIGEDHRAARRLAEGLNRIPGVEVDLSRVRTNIVQMRLVDPLVDIPRLEKSLQEQGVGIGRIKPDQGNLSRLVTHRDVPQEKVDRFLELLAGALQAARRPEAAGRNQR